MIYGKGLLVSFIITLVLSFIPIPNRVVVGTGCGAGLCYEYLPCYGFPFTYAEPEMINSPIGTIHWSRLNLIGYFIVFPGNWMIISVPVLLAWYIKNEYKMRKGKGHQNDSHRAS
jgi:hypothetical protein